MHIKNMKIENFRGIRNMELELHPRMNVFIGINGAGKTSVLDAIATSLSKWEAEWRNRPGKPWIQPQYPPTQWQGIPLQQQDITNNADHTSCTVQAHSDESDVAETLEWAVSLDRYTETQPLGFVGLPDSSSFDPLRQSIERLADRLFISPPIVHFPTDRTARYFQNSVEIPNSILNEVLSGRLPALETLRNIFVPGLKEPYVLLVPPWGNYRAFLDWMNQLQKEENMKLRELQELGHDTSDHNTYQSPKLIAVKRAWSEFFSDSLTNFIVKEYNVYGVSHLYLSCRKHGMEITDMQLSGGEKAILALVGSLAQSYQNDAILLNNSGNPFEKYGIVLIDEIDLHLHPQWQRMILPKLMEVFPNTQFIVTTHSPQILGELRSENVFILTDGENGIEVKRPAYEIFGQTSGILLEDMMQTPERNVPVQEKIDEIFLSIEHGELEEAQKGYTELKSLAADLPEFVKIDMRLGRKEVGK